MAETSEMYEEGSPGSVYPECDQDGPWVTGEGANTAGTYGTKIASQVCEMEVDEANGHPYPYTMFGRPKDDEPAPVMAPLPAVSGSVNAGGGVVNQLFNYFSD